MASRYLIRSGEPYLPAITGNGELVTCVGPSGYHEDGPWHPGFCVFAMAGRRLRTTVATLVRLGRVSRSVSIGGRESQPASWQQEVVPAEGLVSSVLRHDGLEERTRSFVSLRCNAFVGITELHNASAGPLSASFTYRYALGDWEDKLPEGAHSRVRPGGTGADVTYGIDGHLGRVCLRPLGAPEVIVDDDRTVRLLYRLEIPAGASERVGVLLAFGDRRHYYQAPEAWDADEWHADQVGLWAGFQAVSRVSVGDEGVEALREMCMYDLRCNASPWSIPPAYIPTHWEGRTFHDELYPFLGLISAGHRDMAARIPHFRLRTLPQAEAWGSGPGARYPWETAEDGSEGGPFGPWDDEHFHIGQILESAWQYVQFQDDADELARFYPMLASCADYFLHNMVVWEGGEAHVKPCTDYDEAISPVPDGLYTLCAAIRCMEVASLAAERLGVDARRRPRWLETAAALRRSLPKKPDGRSYATFAGAEHHHIAELGPVYPFRIADDADLARGTLERFSEACKADVGWMPGTLPGYHGTTWMWSGAHLATAWALLGDGERAWETLVETVKAAGPGMMPVEHVRGSGEIGVPWFTTAAGAFVFALHSMLVRVTDEGTDVFPALPASMGDVSFEGLAGKGDGVCLSAALLGGRLVSLAVEAPGRKTLSLRIPTRYLPSEFLSWVGIAERSEDVDCTRCVLRVEDGRAAWEA